jgi:hypothetical protein
MTTEPTQTEPHTALAAIDSAGLCRPAGGGCGGEHTADSKLKVYAGETIVLTTTLGDICRAVNAHDALVKALTKAVDVMTRERFWEAQRAGFKGTLAEFTEQHRKPPYITEARRALALAQPQEAV